MRITNAALLAELDDGIKDARRKRKRARSATSKARQEGREDGFQAVRIVFFGSELPAE